MQDRVRTAPHTFHAHHAIVRSKQGEQFSSSTPLIVVGLVLGVAHGLPAFARIGHRLKGARLILAPNLETQRCTQRVGLFYEFFFASASGSTTVTEPVVRWRTAWPVGHQLRSRCQVNPASCSTRQIVYVLTVGKPSGARRSAC